MAPHKPLRYAGPVDQEEQLCTALQSAKPDWSARELAVATDKLAKIGIDSLDELAQALAEGLNTKIRSAGLKTFGSETIIELKKVISTKYSVLVTKRELEEVRAKKQAALDEKNYLEACTLRRREEQLREEVEALVPLEDGALDRRRALEEELAGLRALKRAAAKAEDYLAAEDLKQREAELAARLDALREPEERLRGQRRALRAELAGVEAELAAAVRAQEFALAHAAQARSAGLAERLEALRAQLPEGESEAEGAEGASEPELEAARPAPPAPPAPAPAPAPGSEAAGAAGAARAAAGPEARAEDTDGAREPLHAGQGRGAGRGGTGGGPGPGAAGAAGAAGAGACEAEARKADAEASAPGPETDGAEVQALVEALDLELEDADDDELPALEDGAEQQPAPADEGGAEQQPTPADADEDGASLPEVDEDGGEDGDEDGDEPAVAPQRWRIVGGSDRRGGIMVREGESKTSPLCAARLSNRAEVEEIELVGDRLHFRRLSGAGPDEGWISIRNNDKVLAERIDAQGSVPLALADTGAAASPTVGGACGRTCPDVHEPAVQNSPLAPGVVAQRGASEVQELPALQSDEAPAPSVAAEPEEAMPEPVYIDDSLRKRAVLVGVKMDQLEDLARAEALIDRVERLNKTTAKKLQAECDQMGIASDDLMSRSELCNLVRDAIVREELSAPALREICTDSGCEVDEGLEKQELLQLLKNTTWENMGVPISRLPNLTAARDVHQELRELEHLGEYDLTVKCAEHGLSTASPARMREDLRLALMWIELPAPELRRECAAYGLSAQTEGADEDEEMQRLCLFERLTGGLGRADRRLARGVPVGRLGEEQADEVLRQLDRLQIMGLSSLRAEYRRLGLDFDPGMDAQGLVDRLRDVLVLKYLPDEEFREECLKYDVPFTSSRMAVSARLLERKQVTREWEAQGIPPALFEDGETCEELFGQLKAIDAMSDAELLEWYVDDMGCPAETGLGRPELEALCKLVTLCESLPVEEIRKRCAASGMDMTGAEEEARDALLDKLLEHDRMVAWDGRGFQALRIRDFETVARMVSKYEEFVSMSDDELKSQCADFGISLDADASRGDYLERLKAAMIWEMLPLDELRKDCLKQGLQVEAGEGDQDERAVRAGWIQQLNMEMLKKSFERKGVPVGQLSADHVFDLAMQFQRLDSMSIEELRSLREELIPLPAEAPREELVRRLQDWTLLLNLPFPDLLAEGRTLGLPTLGFELPEADAAPAPASPEDAAGAAAEGELRMRLQSRVFLRRRAAAAREAEEQLPRLVDAAATPSAASTAGGALDARHLPEVWKYICQMRDPFVAEIVCSVPSMDLPSNVELPAEAQKWEPLDAALYVLSGAKFNPTKCNRNTMEYTPEEERKLISVIVPTNSNRRMWHSLLYECFKAQTYEPKELVIVDTGIAPSSKFQEIAKDDKNVVYNFFPVTDMKDPRGASDAKARGQEWSLGLKRNVACRIARGSVFAQFDDDDLYFPGYLDWFWPQIKKAAGTSDGGLGPALAKLSEWHLFDLPNMAFHHMDPLSRKCMPLREQPAALYGWGFSYVFTRRALELSPFPDVHFAEDAGFVEGLLAHGIPVSLLKIPEDRTLVAHTVHPSSTTGGEVSVGQRGCDNPVETPKEFNGIYQTLAASVHAKARTRGHFGQPGAGRARRADAPAPAARA